MFCPSCGASVTGDKKYCVQCGVQLQRSKDGRLIGYSEKRLDDYLEGIFWVTVFGLGMILGGMTLLNQVLHPGRGVIIAYMAISSIAFLIIFGLHLWQIMRIAKSSKEKLPALMQESVDTNKIVQPENAQRMLQEPATSIVDDATRTFMTTSEDPGSKVELN